MQFIREDSLPEQPKFEYSGDCARLKLAPLIAACIINISYILCLHKSYPEQLQLK